MNRELPDVEAGFRKGRGTRDQIANIDGSSKKQESSRKTSISALLTMLKPLTVWIITNCGKFWKRWEYQTTWPVSWEICIQVKKQQLELDVEQQTGSKVGRDYLKAIYCHPAYWTYMQSISSEMQAEWITSWIKIAGRNINNLRHGDDATLMAEREEGLKGLLVKVKEESEKAGLKLSIQQMKIIASSNASSDRLYFLGLQNHCRWWLQPWNYSIQFSSVQSFHACSLEGKLWPT